MNVFNNYARYYDLFYKDKDYTGEAEYVHGLLQRFGKNPATILELGCGTGKHAQLLAEKGYSITGVDQSEEMLTMARERIKNAGLDIQLHVGDVRDIRLNNRHDAVISLFHVMSYQISNQDLIDAFATARVHLKPGGIFIFDCWYGPAVLTEKPVVRVKRLEDETIQVTRIAEPILHQNDNIVDVNYTILLKDKISNKVDEIHETHKMRYLFRPELELLLQKEMFEIVHNEEWVTGKAPDCTTWGIIFIVKQND